MPEETQVAAPQVEQSEANVKELLLEDANRLSASPSKYEATRHQIERTEYKTFTLRESDFYNLVFMEANTSVWANNQKLVNILTPEGKSRTLKEVVDRIMQIYPHERALSKFLSISLRMSRGLRDALLSVRGLTRA